MYIGFETLANHADGIANAILRIDPEFMREDVEYFAVFGESDVASGIDGAANVVALDVSGAIAEGDATAAVDAADMAAGHADDGGFNGDVGHAFGFFDGPADGAHGGIEIDD